MKPISVALSASILFAFGFFAISYGKEAGEKERKLVITTSVKLFPAYFSANVDADAEEAKVFVKNTSTALFSNAAVWPVKNGYVIYKASSPITFILPSRKIRSSDEKYDRLIGIPPSQLLEMYGRPKLEKGESFLKIAVRRVPQAINDLIGVLDGQTEDQFKIFLDGVITGNVGYRSEAFDALRGPFLRIHSYQKCIQQVDDRYLTRSMKAELLDAGLKDMAGREFEYLDFLPLTEKEAILLSASKANGSFIAMSSVSMDGICRYSGTTKFTTY